MKAINKYWWILGVQGLFLLGIGVMALLNADLDLKELVQYLGLVLLGFGVILSLLGLRARKKGTEWTITFFTGIFQVAVGLFVIANPSSSSDIFRIIIGVWALLMAALQLVLGIFSKQNNVLFFINALVSAAFGALIIWYKFDDERSITALVCIYTVILGITAIYYSIRLRIWSAEKLKMAMDENAEKEPLPNGQEKVD